jgi:hypothetical protein
MITTILTSYLFIACLCVSTLIGYFNVKNRSLLHSAKKLAQPFMIAVIGIVAGAYLLQATSFVPGDTFLPIYGIDFKIATSPGLNLFVSILLILLSLAAFLVGLGGFAGVCEYLFCSINDKISKNSKNNGVASLGFLIVINGSILILASPTWGVGVAALGGVIFLIGFFI